MDIKAVDCEKLSHVAKLTFTNMDYSSLLCIALKGDEMSVAFEAKGMKDFQLIPALAEETAKFFREGNEHYARKQKNKLKKVRAEDSEEYNQLTEEQNSFKRLIDDGLEKALEFVNRKSGVFITRIDDLHDFACAVVCQEGERKMFAKTLKDLAKRIEGTIND